jgi:hypothetical protein
VLNELVEGDPLNDPCQSFTRKVQKHKPMSTARYINSRIDVEYTRHIPLGYHKFEGVHCIANFVTFLESVAEEVSKMYFDNSIPMHPLNSEQKKDADKVNICSNCNDDFEVGDEISLIIAT